MDAMFAEAKPGWSVTNGNRWRTCTRCGGSGNAPSSPTAAPKDEAEQAARNPPSAQRQTPT